MHNSVLVLVAQNGDVEHVNANATANCSETNFNIYYNSDCCAQIYLTSKRL